MMTVENTNVAIKVGGSLSIVAENIDLTGTSIEVEKQDAKYLNVEPVALNVISKKSEISLSGTDISLATRNIISADKISLIAKNEIVISNGASIVAKDLIVEGDNISFHGSIR
jgi:hypothetical protein